MKPPGLKSKKIKIILADNFKLERQCLSTLLGLRSNLEIIAQVETGNELLALLENVKPDILVAKIDLLCENPIELLLGIKRKFPGIKILILSPSCRNIFKTEYSFKSFNTFFAPNCDVDELIFTISEVNKNGGYFNPKTSDQVTEVLKLNGESIVQKIFTNPKDLYFTPYEKINQEISDILIYNFIKEENEIIDSQLRLYYEIQSSE